MDHVAKLLFDYYFRNGSRHQDMSMQMHLNLNNVTTVPHL